jgi:hypothetical protein
MLSTACELAGLAALDVAAWLVDPILGVAVLGVLLLVLSYGIATIERERAQ